MCMGSMNVGDVVSRVGGSGYIKIQTRSARETVWCLGVVGFRVSHSIGCPGPGPHMVCGTIYVLVAHISVARMGLLCLRSCDWSSERLVHYTPPHLGGKRPRFRIQTMPDLCVFLRI